MNTRDLALRRDAAAAIARDAAQGAFLMRARGMGAASFKGAQDFLTEADGATERFIRDRLATIFPGEAVLGEEMGGGLGAVDGPLWIIDPIDGTSNFSRNGDRWCVSIGMALDGKAVVGAVARYVPAEVFAGAKGCGATLNGVPIKASSIDSMARATIEVGWSMRRPLAAFHQLSQSIMGMGAGLRVGGSGTLGLVEAANGRLEGYIEQHINSWDACAAVAIAREAGAWVNEFDSGDWLASGNPVGIGAPALGAILAPLLGP